MTVSLKERLSGILTVLSCIHSETEATLLGLTELQFEHETRDDVVEAERVYVIAKKLVLSVSAEAIEKRIGLIVRVLENKATDAEIIQLKDYMK